MKGKKILIIDDDPEIRTLIETTFSRSGAQMLKAGSGQEGLQKVYMHKPDLIILDIMMPEMDGFETCRQIRQLSDTPLIMLTALNRSDDIVHGLEVGADDFVSKPYHHSTLLARARALLRRKAISQAEQAELLYRDPYLTIDLGEHRVYIQEQPVQLTPYEFRLLVYLVQNAGQVCTYAHILENVWGWSGEESSAQIQVYISHLRHKIEPDPQNPQYIITDHRSGYHFAPAP